MPIGQGKDASLFCGDRRKQSLQMRSALLLQMTYPGKKMLFMGTEFAQFREWDFDHSLEWFMLDHEKHWQMRDYVRALNALYLSLPALWEQDFTLNGFQWLLPDEAEKNLVAFERIALNGERVRAVISFSGPSSSTCSRTFPAKGSAGMTLM